MSTLTIVQARLGSQRLPGKALADVGGKTVLERVIERAQMTQADLGRVVVATSARTPDNAIAELCEMVGVECYRSSEHDVLNRFYRVAVHCQNIDPGDTIVRITADCPLLCPELLTATVRLRELLSADYVGVYGAPNGLGQEALSFAALETAWVEAEMPEDREHVITFVEDAPDRFTVKYVAASEALQARAHWRLTLDDADDLDLLRRLFDATGGALFEMRSEDILALVDADVGLLALAERRP